MRHALSSYKKHHVPEFCLDLCGCDLVVTLIAAACAHVCLLCSTRPVVMSHERRLLSDVMTFYASSGGKLGRPVLNDTKAVKVYLRIGLIKLDLDEKEKLLTLATWTSYVRKFLFFFFATKNMKKVFYV